MKNLSIFILTSTFILASCGGGDIKIEDEYRELNKKLTKLKGSERDGMSRKQQENYDIELANIKKLREENRRMKIELTAIKNVIKRYMTNGKFSKETN